MHRRADRIFSIEPGQPASERRGLVSLGIFARRRGRIVHIHLFINFHILGLTDAKLYLGPSSSKLLFTRPCPLTPLA